VRHHLDPLDLRPAPSDERAEDVVLEPALGVAGIVFLWFAITNERRRRD
jgi:hypothetical protein